MFLIVPTIALFTSFIGCDGLACSSTYYWTLQCDKDAAMYGNGRLQINTEITPNFCTLLLESPEGNGWSTCNWYGYGQSYTLLSGYKSSFEFRVVKQ